MGATVRRRGWGWIALLLVWALACREPLQAPKGLTYATNPASYVAGAAITPNVPRHSGGAVDTYAISPTLPTGLALDAKTGVISGRPTTVASAASYTVTATNVAGQATVILSIAVTSPSLSITTQPANQSVVVGESATFSVVASGSGTLGYQWQKNGSDIPQATSPAYATPATSLSDDGSTFAVVVTDAFGGRVTSQTASLAVAAPAGSGAFSATGSMNEPRIFHTATLLEDGTVLVAGGEDAAVASSTAERFDPGAGAFTYTGPLVTARYNHTATRLPSGKVLLVGGVNSAGTLSSAELYDPVAGGFTATGSLAAARSDHSATLLPDGKVLIVGGRASTSTYVATAELYDPTTGAFSATGSLGVARAYHSATLLGTGKVLMVGGAASAGTELYDPTTGVFSAGASLGSPRAYWHAAALLASGKVLIAGGVGAGSPGALLAASEVYDPALGAFTSTGNLVTPREAPSATTLADGSVLVAGGGSTVTLATSERYL